MRCTIPGESGRHLSAVEGEWHLSKDEALRDAERRRVSRIVSLKRQVAKLERLAFAEDL
jgi:hypothetical protein